LGGVSLKINPAFLYTDAVERRPRWTTSPGLFAEIRAFRPFLPARQFETSLRFYKAIGLEAYPLGETLAIGTVIMIDFAIASFLFGLAAQLAK
jgi:hypothetical protein